MLLSTSIKIIESTQVLPENYVLAAIENTLAMIEFDPHGNVLWANENFAATMEYEVSEMPNLHHKQFCIESFVTSREYTELWTNLRNGKSFQEKIQRVTKTGRIIWLEATYSPIFNEQGEVVGVVKIATDITQRENTTIEVASELQQMAAVLNSQAENGIKQSEEVVAVTNKSVTESKENIEILDSLKQQANSIQKITKTIQGIAAQTNLLALNAAIEAARAGEYGRGFNVVATEVRRLADQVKESVADVNDHIEGITVEVNRISDATIQSQIGLENGQKLIYQTLERFTEIGISAGQLDKQSRTFKDIL